MSTIYKQPALAEMRRLYLARPLLDGGREKKIMKDDSIGRDERLVLEAQLANYNKNLANCAPSERPYWELRIQQIRSELSRCEPDRDVQ